MILRSIKYRYSERNDTITHFQELYKLHRRQSKSPTLSGPLWSTVFIRPSAERFLHKSKLKLSEIWAQEGVSAYTREFFFLF